MPESPLHTCEFKSLGHTIVHERKLRVCAQTAQQILKQPSEDDMAVSQNLTAKAIFLFQRGYSECDSERNHAGYWDFMKKT